MAKVAIIMGSNSDLPVVKGAIEILKDFGVDYEARVISAHRTPYAAEEFAKKHYTPYEDINHEKTS